MKVSDEIILQCKKMYEEDHIPCAQIAKHFGIGSATVRRRLKALGVEIIQHPHAGKFNVEEVIKLYSEGIQIWKIAQIFNSSEETISKVLKENGVVVKRKLSFNEYIFDSIDTEEKAYWLGFIWADGSVITHNEERHSYPIEITLAVKDYEHLVKFCSFIDLPVEKISIRSEKITSIRNREFISGKSCRVAISSKNMWNTLVKYNCVPNKTYNEIFPDLSIFKSSDLLSHFMRGFFDGDGWVYRDRDNKIIAGVCGQEQFLLKFKNLLPSKLQSINLYNTNSEILKVIKWASLNAELFLNFLYKDAHIFLDRKFNIAAPYICESISKSDNIGETPEMDNPEVITETKESVTP